MKLNELSGWYRAGLVLSVLWLVASSVIYLSNVGWCFDPPEELPFWEPLWSHFFLFSNSLPLFEYNYHVRLFSDPKLGLTTVCNGLSVSGLISFTLYPISLLWMLGMATAWVFKGFSKE